MNRTLYWSYHGCLGLCAIIMALALHYWGAAEIRADLGEVIGLTFAGTIWLMLATRLFSWFGVSLVDDVTERGNVAALVSLWGAIVGTALIYMGGSVGEGPSYWNNVFSVGLGTVGMFVLWVLLEMGANVSASVAEDRDLASGIRLAGFLVSLGLILGRAVAGDWHSEEGTVRDFIYDGWWALPLLAVSMVIERFVRPSRRFPFRPWRTYGLVPALLYLTLAGGWLWRLGAWEGMRR